MEFLTLFSELGAILLKFIPQIKIATRLYHYVSWELGRWPVVLTHKNGFFFTGFHVVWPLISDVQEFDMSIVILDIAEQQLTTKDQKSVACDGWAYVRIQDVKKLAQVVPDGVWEKYAQGIVASNIAAQISDHEFAELCEEIDINELLHASVSDTLLEDGVKTNSVFLSSFQKVRPHAHWGVSLGGGAE
jgi:regulator of protease activity HflC (stomatin/prohibitin superfamily)